MAKTLPFKAWLPLASLAEQVATRSSGYDSDAEIIAFLNNNPLSYLHAVKPHLIFGAKVKNPPVHFKHGANYLTQMKETEVLHQTGEESYYLYRQTSIDTGIYYQGVIGLCHADAYRSGTVKIHEHTLTEKENLLVEHIDYTRMAGEPVLIMHDSLHDLDQLKREVMRSEPYIEFIKEGYNHQLWIVNGEHNNAIQIQLDKAAEYFIADGHHRSSATNRFIKEKETKAKGFMSLFIDKADLHIEAFHRLVRTNINGLLPFLKQNHYNYEMVNSYQELELGKNQFGFYLNKEWYQVNYLRANDELDVNLIETHVIKSYAGIANSKIDERVDFIEGNKPIYLGESEVDLGNFDLLIVLHPCKIEDICAVAKAGETMPPKSTYVLPKLLTGLTLHSLE